MLKVGKSYRVLQVKESQKESSVKRLQHLGVRIGSIFKVLHAAPLSQDPVAIQVNGVLVALRKAEFEGLSFEELAA